MKSSIGTLSYSFNAQRMVKDYTARFYSMAHERCQRLMAGGAEHVRALANWLSRVEQAWANVGVEAVDSLEGGELKVGDRVGFRARVRLGGLAPGEVAVELYLGRLNADGQIADATIIPMQTAGQEGGVHVFEAKEIMCRRSGRNGYTVRVRPFHVDEARPFIPGLIRWADEQMAKAVAL